MSSLRRTTSARYVSVPVIHLPHSRSRKRKSTDFDLKRPKATCFELKRPNANLNDTTCINTASLKNLVSSAALAPIPTESTENLNKPASPRLKCSKSWASPDLFTKTESHETTTKATLPSYLQGNESFSVDTLSHINPMDFVRSCFKGFGLEVDIHDSLTKKNFFLEVNEDHLAAYQADAIQAIRNKDITTLGQIKRSGRSLQGCNRFGESLMHIACRRGSPDIIKFLITDGECSLRVHDDYGRTPLHDACWQGEPNFVLVDLILDAEPDLLFLQDRRGHTALDYVRREHWGVWIKFLSYRMKKEIRRCLSLKADA